ncbi:uncharacterized protein F5Z01DRAFT_5044 [Emericellopsis atlantica]|uniref:NAD(P)-binding domain-containing protein n=1 Tax=Emericellopsis atlantica TaxID=2614577 RepID=A0A9P7ZWJ6_9HYPO|nr:uncharacterized protein F5Z01DRAFT_5044 [Emericellopsis atlantica]KAG9258828.1 hypothetical protein F5Z01DRAFT_5044 [Emericellopsis atlantica]
MKVIIAGATGTAGRGITQVCLADPRVTKILILTRRQPSKEVASHDKVEVIIHEDFSTWPSSVLEKLEGAEACLWAVGGRVDQFGNDAALARKVGVDYTLAAAKAMRNHLVAHLPTDLPLKQPFRFVLCSGMLAEWDQERKLWFLNDTRKIKGAVEKGLCELADEEGYQDFEVFIARPSYLLAPEASLLMKMASPFVFGIKTQQVGRAMLKMAADGWEDRIVLTYQLQKM